VAEALVARASVFVAAPKTRVWDALIDPRTIERIMPVTEVISGWRPGSPFAWRFEMLGKPYDVVGKVLRFDANHLLVYDYTDPLQAKSRASKSRHRVSIELAEEGTGTRISVSHDNNLTSAALAHAEGGWRLALNNLKAIVEGAQ
jgi:uncharacterized protein YndB with AHSA1/START domain